MDHAAGRILIVDDELSLLKMMRVYLERLGYAVTTAESNEQAWSAWENAPSGFDVAVLDGSMPGLSMQDLALKMLRASPVMCVLAASGYPADISELEAAAPGRVGFLHKPFTPGMLAAEVRRMLAAQEEDL